MELGEGVQRLQVGDRVALEPGIPCWSNPAPRWVLGPGSAPSQCNLLPGLSAGQYSEPFGNVDVH